ncbi:MAG TPA: family 1 glycosylhydrolase [Flavitalea sp.]|nr:family 1 glycosylhydrolase [Flavitalea sp.]
MDTNFPYYNSPEVWGGIECTINRVNDTYVDQLKCSGFYDRENDIDLIASLGIKKLRFPILWELHQPQPGQIIDWTWAGKQLNRIRGKGIDPIVGLLHHGSGPSYTDLADPQFPFLLQEYAGQVAKQFPWVEYYTPVNEPLTTARFSGLYGIWYPHLNDDLSFAKMLLNQIKGIVLAMQEIRKVNPNAKLVQTEDLGKTYSNTFLQYQADFENERRWLTGDLLCGKIVPGHEMWDYFLETGIDESELYFFLENICPPDIMGFNHYITSERFLDDDLNKYPAHMHGGNWLEKYVDTEAVRVNHRQPSGLRVLLQEAWERFGLPMAITEAHLHCSREEQMRWLKEVWDTSVQLKEAGIDLKGVTVWSLLGAYGWNKLLTCENGDYEPGVFDLRGDLPRPTALSRLIRSLSDSGKFEHPLLDQQGWWHRSDRFYNDAGGDKKIFMTGRNKKTQPVLIIGKRGTLGNAFARVCDRRAIEYRLLDRNQFDLCNEVMMEEAITLYKPWAIINAAGFVRVDDAETETDKCFFDNTIGPELLAQSCRKHGIKLMSFSSDLVFDGLKNEPYIESDSVGPLNIYGKSKAKKEELVLQTDPSSLIIRTSAFFGPWDDYNFASNVISSLATENQYTAVNDVTISPTYVPDLVNAALDLLIDDENEVWHLANEGEVTWSDLAVDVAQRAGLNSKLIIARPLETMNWRAARPYYSVLRSEKGILLPSLENALKRFFEEKKRWRHLQAVS